MVEFEIAYNRGVLEDTMIESWQHCACNAGCRDERGAVMIGYLQIDELGLNDCYGHTKVGS